MERKLKEEARATVKAHPFYNIDKHLGHSEPYNSMRKHFHNKT